MDQPLPLAIVSHKDDMRFM